MKQAVLIGGLLLLPAVAGAAGFANQAIFLSRSPVAEGSAVRIYAIVDNESAVTFSGSVVISDSAAQLGSTSVSLAPGATQTVSANWKPAAGKHSITAQLVDQSGNVAETQTANFNVDPKPQPAATSSNTSGTAAAVESSAGIQQQISSYSPQAGALSQPILATIDSLRTDAASGLSSQLTNAQKNLAHSPGPSTQTSSGGFSIPNTSGDFWWILWSGYSWLLQLLLYIVGNVALFYPLFVLAVFYLLFKTYRWARRPGY